MSVCVKVEKTISDLNAAIDTVTATVSRFKDDASQDALDKAAREMFALEASATGPLAEALPELGGALVELQLAAEQEQDTAAPARVAVVAMTRIEGLCAAAMTEQ